MSVAGAGLDGALQRCSLSEAGTAAPEYLDLARMRQRYGWIIGTLWVWANRARERHQLEMLALQAPDSVFEDVGLNRDAAACEARRWFWQELLVCRRP
ncbi:MAG: hypothetical protein JJU09_09815 [Rhodobacteraceae bacterium]|nr:hypothetical protein [Paracoccaceae bacterium]MCC5966643.1 hypothetical protein [Natronohydrobacter sp.]